jgi:cell division protein FtsX
MPNLVVVRDEVDGWDVIREDDPQSLTNTATKESAIEAARTFLADEGGDGEVVVHEDEVHGIDDTRRGVKLYVVALLGLLAVIVVIIVVTSLLAHWTLPGGG